MSDSDSSREEERVVAEQFVQFRNQRMVIGDHLSFEPGEGLFDLRGIQFHRGDSIRLLCGASHLLNGSPARAIARAKENRRRSHDRRDDWNASYESDNGPRAWRFALARDSEQVGQFVIWSIPSKVLPLLPAPTSCDRCAERAAAASWPSIQQVAYSA